MRRIGSGRHPTLATALIAVAFALGGTTGASAWQLFTEEDGLPHSGVRAIHVDGDVVWVGTDAGLARWDDAGWSAWTASDGLPEARISALAVDPRTADLWIGTWGGGLVRFTAGRFDRFTQFNSGIAGDLIFDVAVAGGRVWAATNAGASSYDPTAHGWSLYLEPVDGVPQTAVTGFVAARDGLHALAWSEPPLRYDAARDAWVPAGAIARAPTDRDLPDWVEDTAVPDDGIRCVATQGRTVWVGTPHGVARGTTPTAWHEPPAIAGPPEPTRDDRVPVRIGILGPLARPISRPGADSIAKTDTVDRASVARAVSRAGERVGRGERRPFALAHKLHTFASYGWGTAQDSFALLRDRHDARGFVGFIEPHARLDTAVALRTEVPVVNVAPTEPTGDELNNPWIFRCGSNDPRRQRLLMEHVLARPDVTRLAAIRTPDHESEVHLERWLGDARASGHGPLTSIDFDPATDDATALVEQLRQTNADAVLTWSDPTDSAVVLNALRGAGWNGLFVGGDRIVNREFATLVGANAGPVIAPGRCPHFDLAGDDAWERHDDVRRRLRGTPASVSPHARRSYDATMHLLVAIESAGSDRAAIRDALGEMRAATLATLEDGVWVLGALDPP